MCWTVNSLLMQISNDDLEQIVFIFGTVSLCSAEKSSQLTFFLLLLSPKR